jgi:hypothetical protein
MVVEKEIIYRIIENLFNHIFIRNIILIVWVRITWLSPLGESPGVTPNLGDKTSICIKGPLPREEMKINR